MLNLFDILEKTTEEKCEIIEKIEKVASVEKTADAPMSLFDLVPEMTTVKESNKQVKKEKVSKEPAENLSAIKAQMTEEEQILIETINRLRRFVLIHSFLYYRADNPIISDVDFDRNAYELARLQKENPEIADKCVYAEEFKTFDGTTGFDLPLGDPWVTMKAEEILRLHKHYMYK